MSSRFFGYTGVATDPTRRSTERRHSMPRLMWPQQTSKLRFVASVGATERTNGNSPLDSVDFTEAGG